MLGNGLMRRRYLIFGLAALLFLWNLGSRDLWAPDEPYFGEGAREMVADGKWLVPHVNGVVTTDKPPLFFWAIALLSLPAGEVTGWTARLPSALAALGVLLLVMRLGRRMAGERVAWLGGLVLCTTLMFWQKARWTQIDALLCLLIWVALSAFEAWRAGDAAGWRAGLIFWLAAALAALAKGPVGVLLPLGIALSTLAFDRRLGSWKRFAPITGPLLFAALVGAWIAVVTLFGPGEYSVWGALEKHFIERGIHGLHHRQPPWYYLEVLPVHLLPWSGLVPGALLLSWRRRSAGDRFLLTAAAFVVVFFTISTEKRVLYVLPAVPAFALMVARFVDDLWQRVSHPAGGLVDRRWLYGGQVVIGGVLTLAGAALPVLAFGRPEVPYWMPVVISVILVTTGLVTLGAWRRDSRFGVALTPAIGFILLYLFVATFVYAALEHRKSARPFALKLKAATAPSRQAGHDVVAFDLGNLPEAFAFYTDGVYTITTKDPGVLRRHLAQPERVWAVMNESGLDELPAGLRHRLVIEAQTRLSRRDVALVRNR